MPRGFISKPDYDAKATKPKLTEAGQAARDAPNGDGNFIPLGSQMPSYPVPESMPMDMSGYATGTAPAMPSYPSYPAGVTGR